MVAEQLEQPAAKRSSLAAHCSSNSSRAAAAAMSSGAAGKMGSPQKQELLYNSSGLNTVKISIYKGRDKSKKMQKSKIGFYRADFNYSMHN